MGWLWSSGPAPKNTVQDTPSTTKNQSPPKAPEPTYSDPEIAKFMAQIQQEFGGSNNNNKNNNTAPPPRSPPIPAPKADPTPARSQTTSSSSWWPWGSSTQPTQPTTTTSPPPTPSQSTFSPSPPSPAAEPDQPARLDPLSESLLPTTMSCRQAFDQAFHCNSVGGQWTSVYRSGSVRSCSEQWDDFWFCMRTRAYSGPVKEEAIRDYYRQKELRKYGPGMPSSTDVWEPRTEKLPPGSAFQVRYQKPDIDDEEWRRLEIQHRRQVQRMLREEEERERRGS
ncbi:hypothetical protein GGR51DRAFT_59416 [Nemania sp. FL0031]|nr:hypothetical protein GGR51DRAFT_59416 [Nemania sp. FL0031]